MATKLSQKFNLGFDFTAGDVLLVGVPGTPYDGKVFFVSHIAYKSGLILTHNIASTEPDRDMEQLLQEAHYEFEPNIDRLDPVRNGGPDGNKEMFLVTHANYRGPWYVDEYCGDLALITDEDGFIGAAQGLMNNSFLVISGHTEFKTNDLSELLAKAQLIAIPMDHNLLFEHIDDVYEDALTQATFWKLTQRSSLDHNGGPVF